MNSAMSPERLEPPCQKDKKVSAYIHKETLNLIHTVPCLNTWHWCQLISYFHMCSSIAHGSQLRLYITTTLLVCMVSHTISQECQYHTALELIYSRTKWPADVGNVNIVHVFKRRGAKNSVVL